MSVNSAGHIMVVAENREIPAKPKESLVNGLFCTQHASQGDKRRAPSTDCVRRSCPVENNHCLMPHRTTVASQDVFDRASSDVITGRSSLVFERPSKSVDGVIIDPLNCKATGTVGVFRVRAFGHLSCLAYIPHALGVRSFPRGIGRVKSERLIGAILE